MKWPSLTDPATYVPLLVASLSFPLYAVRRDYALPDGSGEVDRVLPILLYCAMFASAIGHASIGRFRLYTADLLIIGFVVVSLTHSALTGNAVQMLNVGILVVAGFGIRAASFSPAFQRRLVQSSAVLLLFQVMAFILLGAPQNRWVGGIHPNIFGGISVACVALALFGSRRYLDIATLASLAASLAVGSRYAMLCISVAYLLFQLLNIRSIGRVRLAVLGLAAALVISDLLINGINSQLGAAFELDDTFRGLGSGLTGREQHWTLFWPQLDEVPLLGFGFRNRAAYEGVHNGYLAVILENGLLGAGLLLTYCLVRVVQAGRAALAHPSAGYRGTMLCVFVALSVGALLQPQLISFGDCFGFVFLLALFSVPVMPGSQRANPSPSSEAVPDLREQHGMRGGFS